MKLLIPLTILILSFVIYYLFYEPQHHQKSSIEIDEVKNIKQKSIINYQQEPTMEIKLPKIKKENTIATQTIPNNNIQDKKQKSEISHNYISLDEIRAQVDKQKSTLIQNSYEQQLFLQLKKLLQQASSTYYARNKIVLNSPINLILYSNSSREKFKKLLSSEFNIDLETINRVYPNNKTVWDWVLFLAN